MAAPLRAKLRRAVFYSIYFTKTAAFCQAMYARSPMRLLHCNDLSQIAPADAGYPPASQKKGAERLPFSQDLWRLLCVLCCVSSSGLGRHAEQSEHPLQLPPQQSQPPFPCFLLMIAYAMYPTTKAAIRTMMRISHQVIFSPPLQPPRRALRSPFRQRFPVSRGASCSR